MKLTREALEELKSCLKEADKLLQEPEYSVWILTSFEEVLKEHDMGEEEKAYCKLVFSLGKKLAFVLRSDKTSKWITMSSVKTNFLPQTKPKGFKGGDRFEGVGHFYH